jgi:hypothetical protein
VAEIRSVTTLRTKRDEIAAAIAAYERKLGQAQADLAHITAAIKIFEASGDPADMARYVDVYRGSATPLAVPDFAGRVQ